jgi:hypothetical protein
MIQRVSRRLRRVSARAVSPELRQDIFFMHVPKCGGTSLVNAIARFYQPLFSKDRSKIARLDSPASLRAASIHGRDHLAYDREILTYFLAGNYRYVYGHFTFSEKAYQQFKDKYAFVTLLREPVSKWFSLYFYNRYKKSDHYALDLDLEEFVETSQAASYGCDYVMQFIGDDSIADYTSAAVIDYFRTPEAIERACANLDKFDLVGLLEELDLFKQQFQARFGVKLDEEHRRESPVPKGTRDKMITPEILEKVKMLNRPNTLVYEHVANKLAGD